MDPNISAIIVALISAIAGVIGYFITQNVKRVQAEAEGKQERALILKELAEQKEDIKTLSKTLDAIAADLRKSIEAITADLKALAEKSETMDDKIIKGLLGTARDRINQGHRYFTALGKIDRVSRTSLNELIEAYYNLGGNSFVHTEQMEINDLPVVDTLVEKSK